MCGQRLPSVTWREISREPKPTQPTPAQRAGSSLLNLSDDPVSRAAYLLDDEEDHPSHHGRLYLALVLLLLTLVLLIGHRSQTVRGWISGFISHKAASSTVATASPESSPPDTSTPSRSAGAASTELTPSAPTRTPSAETKPSPPPATTTPTPAAESAATSAAPQPDASAASTNNTPPPTNQPAAPAIATPIPVSAPVPRVSGDSLAASGEKYLYGNGVPQDCSLARKNLTMSAERQNPRAQTLLGTMYTTGHCAPRDLPTAYRWFARALHGDPNNAKVAQDLELVWKQMTPSEKQLALQK